MRLRRSILASFLGGLALSAVFITSAKATDRHTYDPVLSLGGTCVTSAIDEVQDPGCPADHPPKGFEDACGTATDPHGDTYVASAEIKGSGGRIDVFDPQGRYLTEIADPNQPCSLAVDSEGNVYAAEYKSKDVTMFAPKAYPPGKSAEEYEPAVIVHKAGVEAWSVAVDPSNDHAYVGTFSGVDEYKSAADGSEPITEGIGGGFVGSEVKMIAVYGRNHEIYVASTKPGVTGSERNKPENARVLMLDGGGAIQRECEVPDAGPGFWNNAVAVDQANGDVYVENVAAQMELLQLGADCHFIGTIPKPEPASAGTVPNLGIAVDDTCETEASEPCQATYDSPNAGHVFVAQGATQLTNPPAHLFAFAPRVIGAPEVDAQAANGVTDTEATLEGRLNPHGLETRYRFEYTPQIEYEAHGYVGASSVPVPDAELAEGGAFVKVTEPTVELEPGTAYRFRLVANNCEAEEAIEGECSTAGEGNPGNEGKDATFTTYPFEVGLPDRRAYELVTPPDTNGRIPTMSELSHNNEDGFDTVLASPDGESVVWGAEGGSVPALGGGGFHDTYEARRGTGGWRSHFTGLEASQAPEPYAGGISPEHGYSFWYVEGDDGDLAQGAYLRGPDGSFEPIGIGGLGTDLNTEGRWIAPGGDHIIFNTTTHGQGQALRLEPCAPLTGIGTIYDRSPGGLTRCLSLPPAGAPPAVVEEFEKTSARFEGAAAEGTAVAFAIPATQASEDALFVRLEEPGETVELPDRGVVFGGISRDGGTVVYLRNATERPNPAEPAAKGVPQGEIIAFDTATKTAVEVDPGDEGAALVNVSPDGSHVYFVSPHELNSGGEGEKEGEENLYAWDAADPGSAHLIGVVTLRDVEGEPAAFVSATMNDGLGLWVNNAVNPQREENHGLGADPSRTTPDGSALVFESRAKLTAYENAGRAEVYRYDAEAPPGERLNCVSCNPAGVPASASASLQTQYGGQFSTSPPTNALARIQNVTDDGRRIFFQSFERLVVADLDGRQDVYEWEAQDAGGCGLKAGCIHLISSGRSAGNDYLYAMTPSGSDVFFETGDVLVPQDEDATPSIYDARSPHFEGEPVGFPPPGKAPAPCLGEACQPSPVEPSAVTPASAGFHGQGRPLGRKHCPKKAKAQRGKKQRCGRRKRHSGMHRHHRGSLRGHTKRWGGR